VKESSKQQKRQGYFLPLSILPYPQNYLERFVNAALDSREGIIASATSRSEQVGILARGVPELHCRKTMHAEQKGGAAISVANTLVTESFPWKADI
jgi:hypothetical protein